MRALFAGLVLLCATPVYSEEGSPRPSERSAEQPTQQNQDANAFEHTPAPFPYWFLDKTVPPVINVYTAKHAGEHEQCTHPENWKEWPAFSYCKADAWLDAERIIALFTIILGIATWLLWRATDKLVKGADKTAERQLRAYVLASSGRVKNFGVGEQFEARVTVRNSGQSPASDVVAWVGIQIGKFPDPGQLGRPPADLHLSKGVMGPGAKAMYSAVVEAPLTLFDFERIRSGAVTIYIFGEVEYLDIFNRKQSSAFRYTYGGPGGENAKGRTSNAADGNRTS